ncbi:hypothetical protein E2C01_086330 [Portunus trituberculatus]|uniref:Uncharacterized protein n=1 Tax=Portunus trituberculatus TaxID=210409 RepID=A0A5B7JG26_PORTR|nr:hypothetical protein [Portunus trituberculatus]
MPTDTSPRCSVKCSLLEGIPLCYILQRSRPSLLSIQSQEVVTSPECVTWFGGHRLSIKIVTRHTVALTNTDAKNSGPKG